MARTTTRDIIKICADLARMDRKAKLEVLHYLQDEVKDNNPVARFARADEQLYPEGGEQ